MDRRLAVGPADLPDRSRAHRPPVGAFQRTQRRAGFTGAVSWPSATIRRCRASMPFSKPSWRPCRREPGAGQPKRGLEIHWPGVVVLLVLALIAWIFW